ncbi:hypothetical protein [Methanomassiliicoccus luminyensis]|uniref:hypothetical protein n=1 Tax=Methanomassiliicoccus luminyensis TaxID=1080712 RepID=UPI00037D459F|nr:hypothetical protein [Methanomassiliicoccus luminyensis]
MDQDRVRAGSIDFHLLKFQWNLNTICNWNELTGRKVSDIQLESDEDTRMVIYCGLKDEVENFTLVDAGRLINARNKDVSMKLIAATIRGQVLDEERLLVKVSEQPSATVPSVGDSEEGPKGG